MYRRDDPERFVTTSASTFRGHAYSRRLSTPGTDKRENNPQSKANFKFQMLPSGQSLALRVVPGVDGMTSGLGEGPPRTGTATTRSVYAGQAQEPWMRGNTARYGNAGRDWARKEVHQQGIAPVVVRHDIQSLATSRSVTRDAYNSEGASTKSREVAGIDARHIEDMFQPEVVPHVAEWIKSSSPWAAEVLLDMLRDVAANSADAARDGVHSAPGTRSPVKLPDMHTL